jgi:hypothetical protein
MLTAKLSVYTTEDVDKMERFLFHAIRRFYDVNECDKKECATCPNKAMCDDIMSLHSFFIREQHNNYPHIKTKH